MCTFTFRYMLIHKYIHTITYYTLSCIFRYAHTFRHRYMNTNKLIYTCSQKETPHIYTLTLTLCTHLYIDTETCRHMLTFTHKWTHTHNYTRAVTH